jgi:hypothetical protein
MFLTKQENKAICTLEMFSIIQNVVDVMLYCPQGTNSNVAILPLLISHILQGFRRKTFTFMFHLSRQKQI